MNADPNLDRLIGQLIAQHASLQNQLARIETAISDIGSKHDELISRVLTLELDRAKIVGGWKAMVIVTGVAVALWNIAANILSNIWPLLLSMNNQLPPGAH